MMRSDLARAQNTHTHTHKHDRSTNVHIRRPKRDWTRKRVMIDAISKIMSCWFQIDKINNNNKSVLNGVRWRIRRTPKKWTVFFRFSTSNNMKLATSDNGTVSVRKMLLVCVCERRKSPACNSESYLTVRQSVFTSQASQASASDVKRLHDDILNDLEFFSCFDLI